MNSATEILHDQKVDSLAIKYVQEGYLVFKKPSADILPFDLGGYCPDLMAARDRGGLMIEVKTSPTQTSTANFTLFQTDVHDYQTQVQNVSDLGVNRGYLANAEEARVRHAATRSVCL